MTPIIRIPAHIAVLSVTGLLVLNSLFDYMSANTEQQQTFALIICFFSIVLVLCGEL